MAGNNDPYAPYGPLGDYMRQLFQIESGGRFNAPQTGSNRGAGQFGPSEERQFGITDANRNSPAAQTAAVAREYAANHPMLTRALGREPTFAEHYFTHQQGVAGGPALLAAPPETPAWQVIRPFYSSYEGRKSGGIPRTADWWAQKAITGNIPDRNPLARLPVDQISAGGFRGLWTDRFNRGLFGPGQPETQMAAATPVAAASGEVQSNIPAAPASPPASGAASVLPGAAPVAQSLSPVNPLGMGNSAADKPSPLMELGKQLMAQAMKPRESPFANQQPLQPGNTAPQHPIQLFGQGGVVTKPTVAVVGENGPEAIVPLSQGPHPYLRMLEMAGRHMQTGDLSDQPPSTNIEYPRSPRKPAHVPRYAEGGIVNQPTLAMVGERGPEAIVPLNGLLGSGATSDPFAAAAARTRAPYTQPHQSSGLLDVYQVLANKLQGIATAPRDAFTGQMQVNDPGTGMPTPEAMRRGMSLANAMFTTGMPVARAGSVGMAGGRMAQPDPLAALREAAREAAQPGVKAALPPPKNLFDRTWDNYTSRMSEPEALESEAVWSTAPRLAEEKGISEHAAFARIMNDWYKRKGVEKRMTSEEANAHMGAVRGAYMLQGLLGRH